ncbi:protein PTHB1-like isoform X3 [Varroa destructor]|uniref:Protein PTHB1 n=1 Tax=Varroa destructor TaxID=109461 RepID=A0A7M7MJH9_VARDE|nr:protein PTHB1-like isoform X3 [Varroa destructor]
MGLIEFGKFLSNSTELVACILHPRKLAIIAIRVNAMGVSNQLEATIKPLYEHKLERCSYVLTKGPFGGAKAADLIGVQSVDGVLSVFDRESHAFDRPLPGALLPGPFVYIEQTDSFVTVTSSLVLETFRYQVLASATLIDDSQHGVRGKRVTSEWSLTLGESISDLQVVQGLDEQLVFALGEQTMFVLKSNAELVYTKRFDFNPRCFHVYQRDPKDPFLWTMVVSQNNTVLVYEKTSLRWAAQVDDSSGIISIFRADLSFLKGVIVLLGDNSALRLCYLGTSPSLFVAAAPERRELPQDPNELKKLHAIASGVLNIEESSNTTLHLTATLGGLQMQQGFPTQTVQITVEPATNCAPLETRILVLPGSAFIANPLEFNLTSCEAKTLLETSISPRKDFVPADLRLRVTVIYRHPKFGIKAAHLSMDLPLELVARVQPNPPKTAKHKVTIESSLSVIMPHKLFPSLVKDSSINEVEFEYFNGARVGFFVAGNKYRIQGDVHSSLALILNEFLKRVRKAQPDVQLHTKPPSLDDYLQAIVDHIQSVLALEDTEKRMEQLAGQYRAVEKRLLAKTKDKTPTPFNNLDKLLDMTHHDLLRTADEGVRVQSGLPLTASSLNASSSLAVHQLELSGRIQAKDRPLIQSLFYCQEEDPFSEFWEEHTTTALCSLMKQLKIGRNFHESSGLQALLATLWDNQLSNEELQARQRTLEGVREEDEVNREDQEADRNKRDHAMELQQEKVNYYDAGNELAPAQNQPSNNEVANDDDW